MPLPRYFTLILTLVAAMALSLPALAQVAGDQRPEAPPSERPVPPVDPAPPVTPETPDTPDTPDITVPPVTGCMELLPQDPPETPDVPSFAACVLDNLSDVAGTTHEAAIVAMVGEGIAVGYADSTFRPGAGISRAEMATMLDAGLELPPADGDELPPDVDPSSVHAPAIAALYAAGVTQGKVDGGFGPDDEVSRAHLAAFLVNAGLVELPADSEAPEESHAELPEDVVGSVHEQAIAALLADGVVSGFEDGMFGPGLSVSRGQAAKMIVGAIGSDLYHEDAEQ